MIVLIFFIQKAFVILWLINEEFEIIICLFLIEIQFTFVSSLSYGQRHAQGIKEKQYHVLFITREIMNILYMV
jgi:hypothetical protein